MLHSGPTLNTLERLHPCAAAQCFRPLLRHTPVAEAGTCLMSDATTEAALFFVEGDRFILLLLCSFGNVGGGHSSSANVMLL